MNSSDVLKKTINEYAEIILQDKLLVSQLNGKRMVVTGATGLIGSNLVLILLEVSKYLESPISIVVLVRNKEKAERIFGDNVEYIVGDVCDDINVAGDVDYIIHGASQTSSKAFVNEPVETINIAYSGTKNILELARIKDVKGLVYLSSMEVYGSPQTDDKIDEFYHSNLDTMNPRNSYPESKRMCESLCTSYYSEYGVPARVVRLTQTFGPGVAYNDGRVFAEFARCAIEGKDIVLHTKGDTKRNYLYTGDAVTAILLVLIKGESGLAYNAANEDTYCSIYEMAELVCKLGKHESKVRVEIEPESNYGYAPVLCMNLNSERLKQIKWKPYKNLEEMFVELISYMNQRLN